MATYSFDSVALLNRVALVALILLAHSSRCMAERLPIKTYTTADGLPRDHINRIVQDSKGFLWFCTTEGLSRFDGYKFTNYGTDQGLPGRQITDFLETRSGAYWVATNKGLCRFIPDPLPISGESRSAPQRFVSYYPGDEALARSVNVIYEDHLGAIWCGTEAGLYRVDMASGAPVFSFVDVIQPAATVDKLFIRAIAEDRRGSLWVIAPSGLYRLRPDGTTERYTAADGLPELQSRTLLADHDGGLWVASDRGLYEIAPDPMPHGPFIARRYTVNDGLADNEVHSLCQSADGTLWVGTVVGLSALPPAQRKPGGRLQTYTEANGLSDRLITALTEDREHNLWIGTESGGVMRLASTGFVSYYEQDGLSRDRRVRSIVENRNGQLCINTYGAISEFDGRRFHTFRLSVTKRVSHFGWGWYQIMFQDSAGEWWVNTGGGVVRYPALTNLQEIARVPPKAIYTTRDGLPTNEIFRLFEDSHRDIWISTIGDPNGVLTRWDRASQTFHRYSPADGVPEAAPTAFCEDASGNLWIGLYVGGVLRYRAGRFTPFTEHDGMPPGLIGGFYLDHSNRLWVATGQGGVVRIEDPGAEHPRCVTYSVAQGLSSDQATCVTEDQSGMMYIGTGRGLDKLDPATGQIEHYTVADGLANSLINLSFRGRDGSLWFGTLQGLSRLIPRPRQAAPPNQVLITGIRVAGTPYPIPELGAEDIVVSGLGAAQNHIQIDFLSLNLVAGETLRYQYKLEGAGDWNPSTAQRTVDYPALPPGAYRFLVRAVGSDGNPSGRIAMVTFIIPSHIWQRWWFLIASFILVAIPVATVARYRHQRTRAVREAEEALRRSREERLRELERVRARIATDLHDDIGSSLTQISILSEVMRHSAGSGDSDANERLGIIARSSRELVDSMSDIVWAINPKKDQLSDLTQRMRRFASDVFTARNIAFRLRLPPVDRDVKLGANLRREVFLIFKEGINNMVRHSGCSMADIEFHLAEDSFQLSLRDDGKGFDTAQQSEGHGLASMSERARDIGGKLEVASIIGGGTIVTLRAPLDHARTAEV